MTYYMFILTVMKFSSNSIKIEILIEIYLRV